jgi:glucosylceramidase
LAWALFLCLFAACTQTPDIPSAGPEPEETGKREVPPWAEGYGEDAPPPAGKAAGFSYDYGSLSYELVWNDEFDYEGPPDPSKWGYDTGGSGWGNNELQYYTDGGNARADGETLMIEAREEQKDGRGYTSARLVTRNKGDWLYGRVEVSAKLPGGKGTWPAIWMLPTDWAYGSWPNSGEIDIMEHVGYDEGRVHATVHTGAYNHSRGTQKGNGGVKVADVTGLFHVYAAEWLPDRILFFIDGEMVYEYDPHKYITNATSQHWPFDKRHHLLINIALGGDWGGARGFDPDMLPAVMEIDYVRVYQSPEITALEQDLSAVPQSGQGEGDLLYTTGDLEITQAALKDLYVTTGAEHMWVRQDVAETAASDDGTLAAVPVGIDPNRRYQPIDGFGASFTDASAYLINQKLSPQDRDGLMTSLFDPEDGIGLSFVRNPMGASDFARFVYSYDDMPAGEDDYGLERFSISHDRDDILPLTKRALALNPDLKLVASPWSPPGWMKTGGEMIGGSLKPECYGVYGDYFIRFLEEYRKEGVEFYAVTPQNEPLYLPGHYPGCSMPASAQAAFIRQSLGPKLRESFPGVRLLCYDHNWDRPDYPEYVLEHSGGYVDGVAWHVYGGSPGAQTAVLEKFPASEVHFTEASGGEWVPPFEQAFFGTVRTGIEALNNHSRSMVLWNMALDEENGPVVPGFGRSTCRGVVTVDQRTGELTYNLDYYALAHFSKFIRPGAVRVASESKGSVYTTACLNTDGTLTVVALNDQKGAKLLRFDIGSFSVFYRASGRSAVTLVIQL